jgi:flagellar biosynthesis chaperone FliJ
MRSAQPISEKPWPDNPVRVVTSRMSAAHSIKTNAPLEANANREAVIDHYELIIAKLRAQLADMRAQLADARKQRAACRLRQQAYETLQAATARAEQRKDLTKQ